MNNPANLEERFATLQRSVRRYQVTTIALLCLTMAGALWGFNNGPQDVKARSVTIYNNHGTAVATLGTTGKNGGGSLTLNTSEGEESTSLSGGDSYASLIIHDERGNLIRLGLSGSLRGPGLFISGPSTDGITIHDSVRQKTWKAP